MPVRAFYSPPVAGRSPSPRAIALALLVLAAARTAGAAKTDVVVMMNGDRITCELKVLQRGKLQVKTDGLGTIDIEWNRVRSVTAGGLFEVEDLLGRIRLGSLQPSLEEGHLDVVGLSGRTTVPIALVARIQQLRTSFWKKLSGSIDVGFSHTSSSKLTQFTFDGHLRFRRPSFQVQLGASSILTSQPGATETRRSSGDFGYLRFRPKRQVAFGQVRVEQNRELGFDLRAGVLGGWGRYLVRRESSALLAAVGLNVNHEVPVEGDSRENVEGLLALDWESYVFSSPKTDLSVRLSALPSLSQWGRWRVDLDAYVRREIFRDFYVTLRGYDNFDSDPATKGSKTNDWGASLTVGYSFN